MNEGLTRWNTLKGEWSYKDESNKGEWRLLQLFEGWMKGASLLWRVNEGLT